MRFDRLHGRGLTVGGEAPRIPLGRAITGMIGILVLTFVLACGSGVYTYLN